MTQEEGAEAVSPFEVGICRAIQEALELLQTDCTAGMRQRLRSATKGIMLTDLAVDLMWERFENNQDVKLIEDSGSRYFRFGSKGNAFHVRVAKVDSNFVSGENGRSERVLNFKRQLDLGIPGMDRLPQLEIGYQLNPAKTDIKSIALIFPRPNGVNWVNTLEGIDSERVLPLVTAQPIAVPKPKVKVKDEAKGRGNSSKRSQNE